MLVIPGYTLGMKTAISVPDSTYERATARAEALGISRSALFSRAVEHYLDELDAHSVTEQIDRALEHARGDASWAEAAATGRRRLRDAEDDW